MGYTNVVQIYQADMSFILQDEMPQYSYPFFNDLSVKSVTTWYKNSDGSYETIPGNLGICCFIWEHLQVVHRILQCLQNISATVSTKKFILVALDATIIGHKFTFDGCIPHEAKVQKIRDWPECHNLTQVCGFLGVCGVLRMFVISLLSLAPWFIWPRRVSLSTGGNLSRTLCSVLRMLSVNPLHFMEVSVPSRAAWVTSAGCASWVSLWTHSGGTR